VLLLSAMVRLEVALSLKYTARHQVNQVDGTANGIRQVVL